MNIFELDINELSPGALAVLRAAIKHARMNRSDLSHLLSLTDLSGLTGLSTNMPMQRLKELVKELKSAPFFSHDFDTSTLGASLVFRSIDVTATHLEFSLSSNAVDAREPIEAANDRHMTLLNEALKMALENADGNAEAFVFYFTATLAGFQGQRMLNENVVMQSIRLLHQLHPSISV